LAAILTVPACLIGAPRESATAGDPAPPSYRVIALDDVPTGWIVGRCRLTAIVPRWNVVAKARCRAERDLPNELPTERMVAAADGGLGGCVVSLNEIAAGKDWPESMRVESRAYALEVGGRQFAPHIGIVRSQTQVNVSNGGPCDANLHGFFGSDTKFNFAVGPKQTKTEIADAFLERPGLYLVRSDCCAYQSASIHVTPHPYVALTTSEGAGDRPTGAYSISQVPPGEYELVCWHEGMEETVLTQSGGALVGFTYAPDVVLTRKIVVRARETIAVDFDVPAPGRRGK
jgi:hypothetical protein